jgi:hypothetical protein
MLSNSQFAAFTGCPETIENPEVAEFALFSIELDKVINPTTGEPFTPKARLEAYSLRPWTKQTITTRKDGEAKARDAKATRKASADRWAERGFAFDSRALTDPDGGVESDAADVVDDTNEWHDFWGGASPTEMIDI